VRAAAVHPANKMTINMTIKDRHWRSIRPKATSMTMPVIIPTSSAAVITSIISRAPSRQTMGRSRDLIQLCAVFLRGCVSYFTLRISLILKDTIKDPYKRLLMKAAAAPVGTPWMWTLAFGHTIAQNETDYHSWLSAHPPLVHGMDNAPLENSAKGPKVRQCATAPSWPNRSCRTIGPAFREDMLRT
jgi:hypothetical protein